MTSDFTWRESLGQPTEFSQVAWNPMPVSRTPWLREVQNVLNWDRKCNVMASESLGAAN